VIDSIWPSDLPRPKDDPQSVNELISAALSEPDEDLAWDAISALHWCGSRAMLGLVRREDPRVLPALLKSLDADSLSIWEVEAASLIGEPDLHPQLVALQGRWAVDKNLLEEAIQACSPRPTPIG
jgi:HEAT repeat protein